MIGKGEVSTLEDLAALDEADVVAGYVCEDAVPPVGASRAFIHGWLNGQVDRGRMRPSEAQRRLAHEFVLRKGKL